MHKLIQKNWERQKTELTHSREMKLSQFRDENDLNADIDIWYMIYDIWLLSFAIWEWFNLDLSIWACFDFG